MAKGSCEGMGGKLKAKGDLHIDAHHTVEDTGIVLGQAVARALGDKQGIARYGFAYLPMDETLTRVAIDVYRRESRRLTAPLESVAPDGDRLAVEFSGGRGGLFDEIVSPTVAKMSNPY